MKTVPFQHLAIEVTEHADSDQWEASVVNGGAVLTTFFRRLPVPDDAAVVRAARVQLTMHGFKPPAEV